MRRSPKMVFQEDFADCGLACLVMIASQFGRGYNLSSLKSTFPTPTDGIGLVELLSISKRLGLSGRALRADLSVLRTLKLPILLHWGLNHYVVLASVRKKKYLIMNPALGAQWLTESHVSRFFTGIAVEFKLEKPIIEVRQAKRITIWDVVKSTPDIGYQLALAVMLSLTAQLGIFLFPVYIRGLIEFVMIPGNATLLTAICISVIPIVLIIAAARTQKRKTLQRVKTRIDAALASYVNRITLTLSYPYFIRRTPGLIASNFQNLRKIRKLVYEGAIDSIVDVITIIILSLAVFYTESTLATILSVVFIVYFVSIILVQRKRGEALKRTAILDSGENVILMENLRNIQTLKLNSLESVRDIIWQRSYQRAANSLDSFHDISTRAELVGDLILNGARYLIVGLAAYFFIAGELNLGAFVAFSLYQALLTLVISNLSTRLMGLWDIQSMLDEISALLLAEKDKMVDHSTFATFEGELTSIESKMPSTAFVRHSGNIVAACAQLSFQFDSSSQITLHDVSFSVRFGEILAITGKSGCGKSTLLRLLTGLLHRTAGEIEWYGISIERWSRSALAKRVASVMQEDQIFSGTLIQNICHFEPYPDTKRFEEACEVSGVSFFLSRLNMGYNTLLSPGSALLSAGEIQRLLLARALYSGADVLLLDEFTGNLDRETEEYIFDELRKKRKTIIMTAHRETTIKQAENVVLLASDNPKTAEISS